MISEVTNSTLPQIKRWSVAFLDPDPSSGQHSGKIREYNFYQASIIFIGGILVSRFKYSIKDSAMILEDIVRLLKEKGWPLNEIIKFSRNTGGDKVISQKNKKFFWKEITINILRAHGGFYYRIQEVISSKKDARGRIHMIYSDHFYGNEHGVLYGDPYQIMHLTRLIGNFAWALCDNINKKE